MPNKLELKSPPVVEVVIGVQFISLLLSSKTFVEFYNQNQEQFPNIEFKEPLPSVIENTEILGKSISIIVSKNRNLYKDQEQNKLIQLQEDRMLFNWRRGENNADYPHFDTVFQGFLDGLNALEKIVPVKDKINQAEITYVDHVFPEDFGESSYKTDKIFEFIKIPLGVKHVDADFTLGLPDLGANMHVSIKSGYITTTQKKVLTLTTTCRGMYKDNNMQGWFESAHKEVSSLFANITSKNAKDLWSK